MVRSTKYGVRSTAKGPFVEFEETVSAKGNRNRLSPFHIHSTQSTYYLQYYLEYVIASHQDALDPSLCPEVCPLTPSFLVMMAHYAKNFLGVTLVLLALFQNKTKQITQNKS